MKKIFHYALCLICAVTSMLSTACEEKESVMVLPQDRTQYDKNAGIDTASPKMDIIADGTAKYKIILPADYSDAEYFAAQEMCDFVRQSTGVSMNYGVETGNEEKFISLGDTKALENAQFQFDYSTLNNDGFFIRTKDKCIYIDGYNDRGMLYGVYEFLERFLGVRFVAADQTYVPETDKVSVHSVMNIVEVPEFEMRNYYSQDVRDNMLFAVRKRMYADYVSGGSMAPKYGYQTEWSKYLPNSVHNSLYFVPEATYKEMHPEFYSTYTNPSTVYTELCYTNGITDSGEIDETMEESVAKAALETIKTIVQEEPNVRYIMFGKMDDGNAYCTCERCQKSDAENGGKTGTHVIFMNAMARAIKEWTAENCPERDIHIVFFAYQYTEQPPVRQEGNKYVPVNEKVVLENNAHVRIAPIGANYAVSFTDERQMDFYKRLFDGWKSVTNNFMIWDYNINYVEFRWYFPNLNYMQENMRYYKELGATYVMSQSNDHESDWQTQLKTYIGAELYWNLDANVSELIDEFLYLRYGEIAAPYVREFINMYESHFHTLTERGFDIKVTAPSVNSEYLSSGPYPLEFLEQSMAIIKRAQRLVQTSNLTQAEKDAYCLRLADVITTPQRMILANYESYYIDGKTEFAREFLGNIDRLQVVELGSSLFTADYKTSLGL